ncbi:MAG: DHH family phosphohydrolase [Harvfovirus sp.]|uniref:DHH family phosphohydrolase n=1 Tax=Harvfovirus sp. TaxID=2487768 RepID=A0A3G5A302_9VIRU|nr:MAG: DHH family phosphohydrolase [Harvfovirus sp.]
MFFEQYVVVGGHRRLIRTNNDLKFDHLELSPKDIDTVIDHGGCTDGFGARFAAMYWFKLHLPAKIVNYYPGSFYSDPPDVKGQNVLFCDFAYKNPTMKKMIDGANKLIILDHHVSAKEDLGDIAERNKLFHMGFSGAFITWCYFHGKANVPLLIEYIQDNDLKTNRLPLVREFAAYSNNMKHEYSTFERLLDDDVFMKELKTKGPILLANNNVIIQKTIARAKVRVTKIKGVEYKVGYVNSSTLIPEIGDELINNLDIDFSAVYTIDDVSDSTIFSLRSKHVDVAKIAEFYGGGGHEKASGCRINHVCNNL